MFNESHLLSKIFPNFHWLLGVFAAWGMDLEMDGEEIGEIVHSTISSDLEDHSSSKKNSPVGEPAE